MITMSSDVELKKEFAKLLTQDLSPEECARKVFPNDMAMQIKACNRWVSDNVVLDTMKSVFHQGEFKLPSKNEHCRKLYDIFIDETISPKDRLAASLQYAQMQGTIAEKKDSGTTVNNKLLVIMRSGTDDEWEKRVGSQQANLVERTLNAIEVKDVTDE